MPCGNKRNKLCKRWCGWSLPNGCPYYLFPFKN